MKYMATSTCFHFAVSFNFTIEEHRVSKLNSTVYVHVISTSVT